MQKFFIKFFWWIINLIFPKYCVGCDKTGSFLCAKCFDKIDFYAFDLKMEDGKSDLDQLFCAGKYQPPLSSLITTFKYQGVIEIGKEFARILYNCVNFPDCDFITAVPMHPKKLKQRGFNQTQVIAKELARLCQIPFSEPLERKKYSAPQASLSREGRLKHLENTFALKCKEGKLIDKSILIIDDVTTTGTTLKKCAEILKQAGAKRVVGVVVAHEG